MALVWTTDWQPELVAPEGKLAVVDRRLNATALQQRIAEPPGPLRATWAGPDPAQGGAGKIVPSARRRPRPDREGTPSK